MKIGLLGGSFDPIHLGHLHMARQAKQEYALDEVWLIPAGHSPNKDETRMTSAAQRLAMCQLAVNDEADIWVCSIEVDSMETSYTFLTLQKLKQQYPADEFYFIMGADSLDYFEKWRNPQIIAQLAVLLIVNRNLFSEDDLKNKINELQRLFYADIRIVHCEKWDVSSSYIRKAFSENEDISPYVKPQVMEYMKANHLYQ